MVKGIDFLTAGSSSRPLGMDDLRGMGLGYAQAKATEQIGVFGPDRSHEIRTGSRATL